MTDLSHCIWRQCLYGEPASKANSRRIVLRGGRPASIKSVKALSYVETARRQVKPPPALFLGPIEVECRIHYASERPDLDPSLILDLLQGLVYQNDRQIRRLIAVKERKDPNLPRCYVTVTKLID